MGKPRTVLMTADTLGGVFTYALTLCTELANRGMDVHLATMGALPRPEQRDACAAVPGIVLHESTYALEWMDEPWSDVAQAGAWLLALERKLEPDVVHINGYAHGALPFKAPIVVVAHSCVLSWWQAAFAEPAPPRYEAYRRSAGAGLEGADAVIAISQAMAESVTRHYHPTRRPIVVHNGVSPILRSAVPKEPFVLSCGRMWDRAKNVEMLARVAPRLSWPVKVAGWDARTYPNVESLGWLGQDALGAVMNRAGIFALPARYEPFGLSAVEAALRGCALVLGNIPSLREIWGDAALFVDPYDDDAFLRSIEMLARDASLRADLAERAGSRALLYRASRMAEAVLGVYDVAAIRSLTRGAARVEIGTLGPCA